MIRIAIAGCRESPAAAATSLYPDVDLSVLRSALEAPGIEVVSIAWDDESLNWAAFDAVVIRSTWDSVDRPTEYVEWARGVGAETALLNPLAAVEWNLDKSYLVALLRAGIAVPRTTFVAPGDTWDVPAGSFVVKPAISGGGRDTALYDLGEVDSARRHVERLHARGATAMVQEYLTNVASGENKHVFIDGAFSHVIRTDPLLSPRSGARERPWEVPTNPRRVDAQADELELAVAALAASSALAGATFVYARVDIARAAAGDPVVLEVELIDPSLSLWADDGAAARLAAAITSRLHTRP